MPPLSPVGWSSDRGGPGGQSEATGLLFRPLVYGVCLDLASAMRAVVGCSAVGSLLHSMYSVVALRPEALCY